MSGNKNVEPSQYCVTVKVYVWANDKAEAVGMVQGDLEYLAGVGDISGFEHPTEDNVVEDNLP